MQLDVVFAAFEDEDIVWAPQVLVINNRDTEKGYIVCPWCKNSMYVAERQNSAMGMIMTKKYFSTIEGEDYDEVKYEVKNGRDITTSSLKIWFVKLINNVINW